MLRCLKRAETPLFKHIYNYQQINRLQNTNAKGTLLDLKRALVRLQKGTFCKLKEHLLKAN